MCFLFIQALLQKGVEAAKKERRARLEGLDTKIQEARARLLTLRQSRPGVTSVVSQSEADVV